MKLHVVTNAIIDQETARAMGSMRSTVAKVVKSEKAAIIKTVEGNMARRAAMHEHSLDAAVIASGLTRSGAQFDLKVML